MADRYLEHAISCLNRAKENQTDGVYCELSIVEVDMIIDLLKEQGEEIENLKQTAQSMMEGICLLNEQNDVELCDRCGRRRLKSERQAVKR